MKRVLALFLVLLMLSGCAPKETEAPVSVPEEKPAVEETESPPVSVPEKDPAEEKTETPPEPVKEAPPAVVPEEKSDSLPPPEPAPETESVFEEVSVPETEVLGMDWAAYAAEVYTAITNHPEFNVLVWEEDEARADLVIRQGENDWNVASRVDSFFEYEWTQASFEDWMDMVQTKDYDPQLSFWDTEGGMSFTCCKNADIVQIVDQTKITYLRAVAPNEEQGSMGVSLYDQMAWVAEDAVLHQVWDVTVDGSLAPEQAAKKMAEKVAENYRNMPEWIEWRPKKARGDHTEVFDRYLGEPQEFCCNMNLKLRFERQEQTNVIYWQAGTGLGEPDENGYCSYFSQVHVRRNEEGDWAFLGRGTGGAMVNPRWPAEKPWMDWLVEVFCLTEGQSHEWYIPGQILSLPPDQMELLPVILDQLTEAEAKDLCATMGTLLREREGGYTYTEETLKPLLGDYGRWLDA